MNCPECLKTDVVFPGALVCASSTIVGPEVFTDGDGLTHLHDPTVTVFWYRCAMDHKWSRTGQAHLLVRMEGGVIWDVQGTAKTTTTR